MTKRLMFAGLFAGFLLLVPVLESKAQDTLKLTLQQCISIAMDENPSIKIAEKEILRTDYAGKEKISALLPAINAQAAYTRTLKKQKLFFSLPGMPANPDGIEVGQDNSFAGVLAASMPIVSPTLWASMKLNAIDAQLAVESARSSRLSLLNSVTKAFYSVLLAQDSYAVFERAFDNAAENSRIILSKYERGAVSEFEWIRADVQLKNSLTNLISAESAVNMSMLQLKMLMGLDMNVSVQPVGSLSTYESSIFGEVLKQTSQDLTGNTDLKQFDIRANQMKQALEVQKTTWLPTLAASFNYQYMAQPNDDVAVKDYYWFPTSNAGLTLSIPIFQGGAKHFKAKQLKVQLNTLEHQREQLKRSIELQAVTYTDNMIKAISKMEAGKKALSQAEKALTISQKMYEVGAGTYLDMTNAELGYIQAGLSYNQAIFDFLSARADLEKVLGSSLN